GVSGACRLSLHDALPISLLKGLTGSGRPDGAVHVPGLTDQGNWTGGDFDALSEQAIDLTAGPDGTGRDSTVLPPGGSLRAPEARSEEHTSELQSREKLVC